jgi:threonine dehydratase
LKGTNPLSIEDIQKAAYAIHGQVERTPTRHSQTLSKIVGAEIFLKFENFQFTSSFKERGALNKLLSLTLEEKAHGVVAIGAGNHAQAVAYHAGRLGIRSVVVAPVSTPFDKVKRVRDLGATVVVQGDSLDEATEEAKRVAALDGATFIHPYEDAQVIAGHGTVALEMLADVPDLDALFIPIGGGGLIAGMAIAARTINPEIRINGVQAEAFPSMLRALQLTKTIHGGDTIARAIAMKNNGHPSAISQRDIPGWRSPDRIRARPNSCS